MPPTKSSDLVCLVDHNDEPIGSIRRGDLAAAHGLRYRTAHAFLFNGPSLLLQELGPDQAASHRLGSSVAAYVRPGETYRDAIRRRTSEELGLEIELEYVGKIAMADTGGTKHVALFAGSLSTRRLQIREPRHVAAVRWMNVTAIVHAIAANPSKFTATFVELFKEFYPDGYRRIARSA